MNKALQQLVDILNTPSPSGDTKEVISLVKGYFDELGVQTRYTNKGALIATITGVNTQRHRVISAHVDTLGAMVKEITPNGRLRMSQIGGYPWNAIEGEYCTISSSNGKRYTGTILTNKASTHVHGAESSENKRSEKSMEVRIDEVVSSQDDVKKLGISVGDFIYFDPRCEVTESGYIKSRHLDDKAGVACLLAAVRELKEKGIQPAYTTHCMISNYEEVGHGANSAIPQETFEYLAVDMAAPGDGQTSHEQKVTICAKDSSGPYDLQFRNLLTELGEKEHINYVVDIYPFYGSDASAMLRAGHDIRHALIGPGVDASHSFERTHVDGLEATTKLLVAYMVSKETSCEHP